MKTIRRSAARGSCTCCIEIDGGWEQRREKIQHQYNYYIIRPGALQLIVIIFIMWWRLRGVNDYELMAQQITLPRYF